MLKAPNVPWARQPRKGRFCPFCTPTLLLNPTPTVAPTPTLSLALTVPLPLVLALALNLSVALSLMRSEYWDRAGGGRNIVCETSTTNEVHPGK